MLYLTVKEMNDNFPPKQTADLAEDFLFGLEKCEVGDCLEYVKKPNLPVLYINLMEQKSRFGKNALTGYFVGESKTMPADSCT